jgi:misacylated tRNA(Ala) deacylase
VKPLVNAGTRHTHGHATSRQVHGALVTGAQLNPDGTARMDFDLSDADSDRLRQPLEAPINDVIRQDPPVRYAYVLAGDAAAEPGLIRNWSVAPPPDVDGLVRGVEIVALDRRACGAHLASTGRSRPLRILKTDSKGRQNRRVCIGLVGAGDPARS